MQKCRDKTAAPVLCFRHKGVHVHFLGFVHGAPPKYKTSEKLIVEINEEIREADVVFGESYSKQSLEYSIGYMLSRAKKWMHLDSVREIDELFVRVGKEQALEMLEGVKAAGKEDAAGSSESVSLLLRALEGDHKALRRLQRMSIRSEGAGKVWDELRNVNWAGRILAEMYDWREKKAVFLILAGARHNKMMRYLEDAELFEREYKRLYGKMPWKAHEMVEILQKVQRNK